MNFVHTPATLTADHMPAFIRVRNDRAAMRAANDAIVRLATLARLLTFDDLARQAVVRGDDAAASLTALADSLTAALDSLQLERAAASELLRADMQERHGLDIVAMEAHGQARTELTEHMRQVAGIKAAAGREAETMRNAGLSEVEIYALLDARNGRPDPQIEAHQQAALACAEVVANIDAFLSDPLRNPQVLGETLLADLRGRAAGLHNRASQSGEWLERKSRLMRDAEIGERLTKALRERGIHGRTGDQG